MQPLPAGTLDFLFLRAPILGGSCCSWTHTDNLRVVTTCSAAAAGVNPPMVLGQAAGSVGFAASSGQVKVLGFLGCSLGLCFMF